MNKSTLKTAGVILAVYGICAFIQIRVMRVPLVGMYLPGGTSGVAVATSV